MLSFKRQIQIASDTCKGVIARLAGVEIPAYEDKEQSFADLQARIAKTIAFIESFTPAQIDGTEDKDIVTKRGDTETHYKGMQFLLGHALPNVYFHVSMAYSILRHNGVEVRHREERPLAARRLRRGGTRRSISTTTCGGADGPVPLGNPIAPTPEHAPPKHAAHYLWAVLIARIYEVFPLLCPMCGGQMRLIAFITEGPVILNRCRRAVRPVGWQIACSGEFSGIPACNTWPHAIASRQTGASHLLPETPPMTISMFHASAPRLVNALTNLSALLSKAQ
eukprot:gene20489-40277_t